MPYVTPNIGLKKPLDNEAGDIAVINENMDKIDAAVEDLKQSGVNGKNLLEATVIAKEGTVSKQGAIATFVELENGIMSIPVGIDTSNATALSDDIAKGKTAYARGEKVTGNIDKDKLLTLVNEAEAGDSAIKSNVVSLLNAVSTMYNLGLTDKSTWANIQSKISMIKTGIRFAVGDGVAQAGGMLSVSGLSFKASSIIVVIPNLFQASYSSAHGDYLVTDYKSSPYTTNRYALNYNGGYVDNTGFKIKVADYATNGVRYYAFEY